MSGKPGTYQSRRAFSNWVLSFGMVIVCPLRPRYARPPLPKGEARDARTVHRKVYRSAPFISSADWSLPHKKSPACWRDFSSVLALPIFPASHPASIVGANELNFCVRDGNRWTLIAINTNYFGWILPIVFSMSKLSQALTANESKHW